MITFIQNFLNALKSLFIPEHSSELALIPIKEQVTPVISSFVANARRFWRLPHSI